jgi:hypothetical protein
MLIHLLLHLPPNLTNPPLHQPQILLKLTLQPFLSLLIRLLNLLLYVPMQRLQHRIAHHPKSVYRLHFLGFVLRDDLPKLHLLPH